MMKLVGLTHGGFYSHLIHRRIGRRTDQHM
jgi:hypothetical protein